MYCKRDFAFLLISSLLLPNLSVVNSNAETSELALGCNPLTSEEVQLLEENSKQSNVSVATNIPSAVDLSTSKYFPKIGSQGYIGSCASWATTYYQFTYEANKLNNITTTEDNSYSPRWTYNFVNSGYDNGSTVIENYEILKNQGAVKLSDYPYSSKPIQEHATKSDYSYE